MMDFDAEAARQQALLAAITQGAAPSPRVLIQALPRAPAGVQIYRSNAHALAERALGAAFPTLQALLGTDDFRQMAGEFWRAQPPQRGDIGVWGDALPQWLRAHPGLASWPYLGDCAQLDWLCHDCERAADANLDAASLALFDSHEPTRLTLVMRPGTAVLDSRWPVASLYAAHQADATGFDSARDAIAAQRGETILVARRGWRAVVHTIDVPTCVWTRDLLGGASLGEALARAGPDFDFTAWLTRALAEDWLQRIVARPG
jgi:hypothetical protein